MPGADPALADDRMGSILVSPVGPLKVNRSARAIIPCRAAILRERLRPGARGDVRHPPPGESSSEAEKRYGNAALPVFSRRSSLQPRAGRDEFHERAGGSSRSNARVS